MKEDCIGDEILSEFSRGVIFGKTLFTQVDAHLQQCDDCLARLEALAKTADPLLDRLPAVRALPMEIELERVAEQIASNLPIDSGL
ncbi:MAG: hypothetical protein AB8B91_22590 [Rubripirellula sp.]